MPKSYRHSNHLHNIICMINRLINRIAGGGEDEREEEEEKEDKEDEEDCVIDTGCKVCGVKRCNDGVCRHEHMCH